MKDKSCFDLMNREGGVYFDETNYIQFSPASTKSALQGSCHGKKELQEVHSSELSSKGQMISRLAKGQVNNSNENNYYFRISGLSSPINSKKGLWPLDQSICPIKASQQGGLYLSDYLINSRAVQGHDCYSTANYPMNQNFSKPSNKAPRDSMKSGVMKANMLSQKKNTIKPAAHLRHPEYHLNEKYCTKQSLQNVPGFKSQFVTEDGLEIEIVQDISTVVLIKNQFNNQALRAVFEEQNTYSGAIQN